MKTVPSMNKRERKGKTETSEIEKGGGNKKVLKGNVKLKHGLQ